MPRREVLILCLVLACASFLKHSSCEDDVVVGEEETVGNEGPVFKPPTRPSGSVYFEESFSNYRAFKAKWIKSSATKDGADSDVAKYDGKWELLELETDGALKGDVGLVMSQSAKHYAIAAKLDEPFKFDSSESLVVQYEVNFQTGLSCGGAYIKLLSEDADSDLSKFHDKTPYSIMFGPDKCGMNSKVHFIVRFKNPVTGEIEEKHSKQSEESKPFFDDKRTHLFTLLIHSDNTYHIIIDQQPFLKGNLLEDMNPPIIPKKEIDDPDDKMPDDWDEREKIPDPLATKPEDWDEDAPPKIPDESAVKPEGWLDDGPEYIPDPDAQMPEDWDEDEDGDWEPPMIPNPACENVGCGEWTRPMIQNPNYKGKWKAPMIDNPEYDGKWFPRKIPNPAYFEDDTPFYSFTPITAIGLELWTMSEKIFFDNILVSSELAVANNYAYEGWTIKFEKERAASGSMSLGPWAESFVELANTYPYLWALYAVALALPIVLCVACCCKFKSKPSKKDEAAERKKTDAPSPDDPQETQTEVEKEQVEKEGEAEGGEGEGKEEDKTPLQEGGGDGSLIASTEDEEHAQSHLKQSQVDGEGEEEEGDEGEGSGSGDDGGSQAEDSQEEEERESQEDDADVEEEEEQPQSRQRRKHKPRRED